VASIIKRGMRLYAKIKNLAGEWVRERTPFVEGQEAQAKKWAEQQEADMEAMRNGTYVGPESTLADWIRVWGPDRSKLGVDGNNDVRRLELHVLPRIGHMPIASIEPKHLVELFATIRTTPIETPRGLEPPAARTVRNIYSALCAAFRDAQLAGRLVTSPCVLTERQLGNKVDATPGWRNAAVFTKPEAQELISSAKIPLDRRVVYAIEVLAGLRPGESSALRVRHYDRTLLPLRGLFVGEALNTKRGKTKRTKTDTEKWVPVHPTLELILDEWLTVGWPAMMGRDPTPNDLIVPMPPADAAKRTKRRDAEPFRTTYYSDRRWRDEDLPALGWRHRRHYDMRATFITLLLDDGGDLDVVERRITHTKQERSAFAGYNRGKQWERTCAELVKLSLVRLGPGDGPCLITTENQIERGLRRRVSNPIQTGSDDTQCESVPDDNGDAVAPGCTDEAESGPRLVQGVPTTCDAGLALLRAAVVEDE
jgi:integrase